MATTIDAKLQELAREAVEKGLVDLDGRQGFRGPSGRVAGKALDAHRRELGIRYNKFLKGSEIVEGIVDALREGRDQPEARRRIGKLFLASARAFRPGGGDAANGGGGKEKWPRRAKATAPAGMPRPATWAGRLQPRAALREGAKPLAERFKPGDLVRVRLAECRRPRRTARCRWRWSWGRRRRWW